jgi:hypothetical protein
MKSTLLTVLVVVLVLLPLLASVWPFLQLRFRAQRARRQMARLEKSLAEEAFVWSRGQAQCGRAGNLQPARLRARPWRTRRLSGPHGRSQARRRARENPREED